MIETWRWFGPEDPVTLAHVRQTGASGVVTALHHINQGQAWPLDEVLKRKAEIEAAGLTWDVVESISIPESIKTRSGDFQTAIDHYKASLRAVGQAGIRTVCYNFMAITDWTRTDLEFQTKTGAFALRFDAVSFAAYDLFVLDRPGAQGDYTPEQIAAARARLDTLDAEAIAALERNLIEWLPAREFVYDRQRFLDMLAIYRAIPVEQLRANLFAFLAEVLPVAEEAGVLMCIHADDPAFPIFGLPRVMSTAEDARKLFAALPSPSNGLTLCTGSFGSNRSNDLVAMAREFAPRIYFTHLRNTTHEADGSFYEADHLGGDTDVIGVVATLLAEETRRRAGDDAAGPIPFRPDHGHLMMGDIGTRVNPGYSGIGRMRGLAELRGVIHALEAVEAGRIVLAPGKGLCAA